MTRPRDIADSINRINSSAADATAVTIDSSERVGIGETSPTVPLEVKGAQAFASSASNLLTSTTKAAAKIRGSNDASAALFFGSLTGDAEQYIQSCNGAGDGADDICLNPFGGNVGIGVTTANTYSGFTTVTIGGSGNADLDFERNGTVIASLFTETSQNDFDIQATSDLVFQSGGSNDRMRIKSDGAITTGGTNISVLSGNSSVTLADDASYTISSTGTATAGGCLLCVYEISSGDNALFHTGFNSSTILSTANNTFGFSVSDTDGKICIIQSAHNLTLKNRAGLSRTFKLAVYGAGAENFNL